MYRMPAAYAASSVSWQRRSSSATLRSNPKSRCRPRLMYAGRPSAARPRPMRLTVSVVEPSRAVGISKMRHDYDARMWLGRDTRCSANRSTARETAAPGTGCSWRRSVTCAGLGPALAVSRLSRATRRSQGSLPQHVSRRSSISTARRPRRRAFLRGATVSAVTNEETRTGSERDCRAAHGGARVAACVVESPFFHGVEPGVPDVHACTLGWESERRVRMRRAATAISRQDEFKVTHYVDAGGASSCRIVGMSSETVGCMCIARWRTE